MKILNAVTAEFICIDYVQRLGWNFKSCQLARRLLGIANKLVRNETAYSKLLL